MSSYQKRLLVRVFSHNKDTPENVYSGRPFPSGRRARHVIITLLAFEFTFLPLPFLSPSLLFSFKVSSKHPLQTSLPTNHTLLLSDVYHETSPMRRSENIARGGLCWPVTWSRDPLAATHRAHQVIRADASDSTGLLGRRHYWVRLEGRIAHRPSLGVQRVCLSLSNL